MMNFMCSCSKYILDISGIKNVGAGDQVLKQTKVLGLLDRLRVYEVGFRLRVHAFLNRMSPFPLQ